MRRLAVPLTLAFGLALLAAAAPVGRDVVAPFALGLEPLLVARPVLALVDGGSTIDNGRDGRLTFLLLGSDARGGDGVARTDTIMVVSLAGKSVTALSIPRDTANIPNPDGGKFTGRVNAVLQTLARGRSTDEALTRFSRVIEHLLGVEIDYYAMIKFDGFQTLVEEVEPIPVTIKREVRDSSYWDDPRKPSGVYFPVATDHELSSRQPGADPLCNGRWKSRPEPVAAEDSCHRAMPFVRSRKGKANSDFARARRQQDFVVAAMDRVLVRGRGTCLTSLVGRAGGQIERGQLFTDLPLTASNALALYDLLDGATLQGQVVFSPPRYATHISGTATFEVNVAAVRAAAQDALAQASTPSAATPVQARPTSCTGDVPASTAAPASSPSPGTSAPPSPNSNPSPTATPALTTPMPETTSPAEGEPPLPSPEPDGQVSPGEGLPIGITLVLAVPLLAFPPLAFGLYRRWRRRRRNI